MLEEPLLRTVVARTRETGEIDQEWDFVQGVESGLGWEEEIECHFAFGGGGIVGQLEELAAE